MHPGVDLSNFSDRLLAAGRPSDVAVIDGQHRHDHAELASAAARVAGGLLAAGVRPGASIAVVGSNSFFLIAAYLAAMKLGVAVPLSERTPVPELGLQVSWAGCAAVLMDRRAQRRLGRAFGDLPVITDAVLSESAQHWPVVPTGPEADAALMFTSGTTSRPKAVRITHANLHANTEAIVEYLGLRSADRMLVILPLHYCFGASLLHTHLAVGGSVVLCNTLTFPETVVEQIEAHGCTGLAGVPSSFQLLLRASSYPTRQLKTLRTVQQAGGRLAPDLIRQVAEAQPQSRLFVMYGQTEATARLSYLPPERLVDKLGSIGRGIPGVDLRVVDADGVSVEPGQQGEIVARGPSISPGYLGDPEATAEKFPGGALRTGDLATVDDEGFIYIVGRSGEFIKSWGYRVSPQQVEEAALMHSSVADAAVVGLPDAEAGEAITMAVVPVDGAQLDPAQLVRFLSDRLPKHMLPQSVHVLDSLPVNASGKVALAQLRSLLAAE
ncbi:MAG: AMP-binding protein [Propionibacteriaceae bacterium]|jgi:acyl-CoA synthetase (AMP-forming)/AMP-acid ligase II|nr:AMP-binding protein [Propionibacteriaceae bacterium]